MAVVLFVFVFLFLFYFFQEATFWSQTSLGYSPDNGSSFGTRGFLRFHWTRLFVWLFLATPDWLRGFDGRCGPPPVPGKKKSPPEVSINQRGVRGGQKEKRGSRSGRTEIRAERQSASELSAVLSPSGAADMTRSGLALTQCF